MASFREQYEAMFGKQDDYDPLSPTPIDTQADSIMEAAPSASPAVQQSPPRYALPVTPGISKPEEDESGFMGNLGRQFAAGTVQVGEMALGAGEYAARQYDPDGLIAETFYGGRQGLAGVRENILSGINEADLQKAASELLTLDPDKTIWQGNPLDVAEAVMYKVANALPATLVTLIPAARWARAASPGKAVQYMGASEGIMSLGGIQNGIADEIMSIPTEELVKESPRFAELLQTSEGDADAARNELIAEAQGAAPIIGGATVAAISAVAGRYFTPIFEKPGQALGSRVARGFAAEAPQEGAQGASEQFMQNYSAKIYDLDRNLSEGVAEAAAQEGLIGGAMGGGFAGLAGQRPPPPAPPPPPPAPPPPPSQEDEGGQLTLPGMDRQQINPNIPQDEEAAVDGFDPVELEIRQEQLPLRPRMNLPQRTGRELSTEREGDFNNAQQQSLPLIPTRERGVGRTTAKFGQPVPSTDPNAEPVEPAVEDTTDPEAVNERQFGMFKEGESGGETVRKLDTKRRTEGTGQLELVAKNKSGKEVFRKKYKNEKTANQRADRFARQGMEVSLLPVRETKYDRKVVEEKTPYKPAPPARDTSIEEEVSNDIRSNIPFEERDEALETVRKSRSVGQAADKLIGAAADERAAEERSRIDGFDNPANLTFDNPDVEAAYTKAWKRLNDATEVLGESKTVSLIKPPGKGAIEKAKRKKVAARKQLAEIRQASKPKRKQTKSERLAKAAAVVNKGEVKELLPAEKKTDSDDAALDEARAAKKEGREPEVRLGSATPPRDVSDDDLGGFKARDREAIDALIDNPVELDKEFERAVRFREGREQVGKGQRGKTGEGVKLPVVKYTSFTKNGRVNMSEVFDTLEEAEARVKELRKGKIEWKTVKNAKKTKSEEQLEKQERAAEEKKLAAKKKSELAGDTPTAITGRDATFADVVDEDAAAAQDNELDGYQTEDGAFPDYRSQATTPGEKLKFIRREAELKRRADSGQAPVASSNVRVTTKGDHATTVDTKPLTIDRNKMDESVADRVKRKVASQKALKTLNEAADSAQQLADKLNESTDEVDSNFLLAREYLNQIVQLARALSGAKNSSKDGTKLAEQLANMLNKATAMDTPAFTKAWSRYARGQEIESLKLLKNPSLTGLRNLKTRLSTLKKTNSRIVNAARNRALHEHLKQDQLYNRIIGPLLQKMTDYVVDTVNGRDVSPPIPNEIEIAEVTYAMETLRRKWQAARSSEYGQGMQREFPEFMDDKKENVYKPLRKQLEFVGFQFNETGNITGFEASENYLGPRARRRYGKEQEGGEGARLVAVQQFEKRLDEGTGTVASTPRSKTATEHLIQRQTKPQTVAEAMAALDARKAGKKVAPTEMEVRPGLLTLDAVNRLIERFQSAVAASKVTQNGIKRQEQRFIRGLVKLGVWKEKGSELGTISIPGMSSKNYRLVGPRLTNRKMTNAEAKEVVQKVSGYPIPKGMQEDVARARADQEAVEGLENFLSENDTELFLAQAGITTYDREYTSVMTQIDERLSKGSISAHDVIDIVLNTAPQDSFYSKLAEKLAELYFADVEVGYGTDSDFGKGELGLFYRDTRLIILNKNAMELGERGGSAKAVHTVLHEMVHAVTHTQIDTNPALRQRMEELQLIARQNWEKKIGGKLPYGLKVLEKPEHQAHEFLAEAMSNYDFQMFLKETQLERQSLWRQFVNLIRSVLSLELKGDQTSIFDAIMLTEDIVFDHVNIGARGGDSLAMTGDGVVDNVASFVSDQFAKSSSWLDKAKNVSRNLVTFRQLYDMYAKHFDSMEGGNGFKRYMDAFYNRNSAVSRYMKEPEEVSSAWTELEASDPDAALEISRLGTEATTFRMTPGKQLTTKERLEVDPERLAKYDELRARYLAMPQAAKNIYDSLGKYYKESAADESRLLIAASLRGVLTKGKGAAMTSEEYQRKFTDGVIDSMVDRDSIMEHLKDVVDEKHLEDMVTEITRMAELRTIGYGDYFPLMRYGDFVVWSENRLPEEYYATSADAHARRKELLIKDPTLEVGIREEGENFVLRPVSKEFYMHESKSEAEATKARLKAEGLNPSDIQTKISRDDAGTAIASNQALQTILATLDGNPHAQQAIKNHYLRSLSDSSFRKRELKRQNRKGVDYDLQHRNLANYLKQSSYYRAQLKHGWKMGEALTDMIEFTRKRSDTPDMSTEQLGQVVKNIRTRDAMTYDPAVLNQMVRKGVNLTQFMMLTSPSYWMINASQPWLVTAPIMGGRHGYGASFSALKDAMSIVKTPMVKETFESWGGLKALKSQAASNKAFNVIDQLFEHLRANGRTEYVELIEELRDNNIIDINVLTELREIADGIGQNTTTRILDASRILAHITEVNNRVVTAIAAYQLELNKTGDVAAAKQYAADMVAQTQFDYSTQNKPPLFQSEGPLKWAAPLMFQFMQWPQHMYALLIRNVHASVRGESPEVKAQARKALTGLLTTHLAVGGTVGMALQPIKWALGMVMMAFGDDDEPYTFANAINGRTFDQMIERGANEAFGDTLGRVASRGLPTVLGADLSARMAMGTLYFVDLRGDTAESVLGSLMASFGGATLNQAMNWGNALGKVADGELYRGVEQGMPKIFRDLMRANRYWQEGLVNNAGDTVIDTKDLSFAETFMQGIGFQPDDVSKFYQGQAAIKGAQGYARDRRERLIRSYIEKGPESDIIREITKFNRAYPSLRLTRSSLIRSARMKIERENRYDRYGANVDEKESRDFARYGDPYK